jgi:hypothetical protein
MIPNLSLCASVSESPSKHKDFCIKTLGSIGNIRLDLRVLELESIGLLEEWFSLHEEEIQVGRCLCKLRKGNKKDLGSYIREHVEPS